MKEQAYNIIKTKNKTQELNVKAISRSPRPCYGCERGSSKSIKNQASGEIVSLKISSQIRKLVSRDNDDKIDIEQSSRNFSVKPLPDTPFYVLNGKSPYEMIYKKCPTLSHLRVLKKMILKLKKNDSANVFQDVNHINFFDIKYPEMLNDDERVANDLNKGKSDSSSSSMSGSNFNTTDFPVGSGNDADSSDGLVATQNEEVATLE
ncbi:hypothetical protein Tco_0581760, partial [Tanacetum coccineum]